MMILTGVIVSVVSLLALVRVVRGPTISPKRYAEYLEKAREYRSLSQAKITMPTTLTVENALKIDISPALKKRLSVHPPDWLVYLMNSEGGLSVCVAPPEPEPDGT